MSLLKSAIQSICRTLYPIGSKRKVHRGLLAGSHFVVQEGMGAGFAFGRDSYNHTFFGDKLQSGSCVFDVGANCGQMAMLFSKLVGNNGQVFSFEPVPRNAALLRRNLAMNQCDNVKVVDCAVGRAVGESQFNFDDEHHAQGSLVGFSAGGYQLQNTITVACETLDHFATVNKVSPDLLKIDVEGGAEEVIAGAQEVLSTHSPAIYFEMHATTEQCPEFKALLHLKHHHGYTIQAFSGRIVHEPKPGWGTPLWLTKDGHPR